MSRSLRPLLVLLAASLLSACSYGDGDWDDGQRYAGNPYHGNGYAPSCGTPEETSIDVGGALDVEPGAGAGVFVEYEAGGTYRVRTSCDTASYGSDCPWDLVVTLLDDATVESISPLELEPDDALLFSEGESVQLLTQTGTDFDGFSLQTQPGAAIRLDALLDSGCAERYLFWVGDGALHNGAPSSVLDLIPSEP